MVVLEWRNSTGWDYASHARKRRIYRLTLDHTVTAKSYIIPHHNHNIKQAYRSTKSHLSISPNLTQYNNQPSSSPNINPTLNFLTHRLSPIHIPPRASVSKSQKQPRPWHEQVRVHESYLSSRLSANHTSNVPPPSPLTTPQHSPPNRSSSKRK